MDENGSRLVESIATISTLQPIVTVEGVVTVVIISRRRVGSAWMNL